MGGGTRARVGSGGPPTSHPYTELEKILCVDPTTTQGQDKEDKYPHNGQWSAMGPAGCRQVGNWLPFLQGLRLRVPERASKFLGEPDRD